MAASGGSPGPLADLLETEESADPGPVPNKRKKIQAAATELVGGSNTDIEEEMPQRRTEGSDASPAAPVSTLPPRPRFPPFPKPSKSKDVRKWGEECRRIREILAKDPRNNLPTRRKPKDPDTTDAVQSSRDKVVVRGAARSIVSVSSVTQDGSRRPQCTGIIMGQRESNGKQHTIIVTCSKVVCKEGTLLDPVPKLSVGLPNKTILDGQLMFFNDHYDIALLEIDVDFPLQRPSIGSGPNYGQEVFVLARDKESSLMARHGEILWLQESAYLGRNYQMFLSCEVPVGGNGGPVIDHDGNVIGMAFCRSPDSVVLSISTIVTCIEMWLKFSRIARPILGLGIRTIELLDVSLQEEIFLDHDIDSGFIVDMVSCDSAAESLGILPGDVIISFDERHALPLPQLEDYLLSLGWTFLNNSSSMVDLKLEVYDLIKQSKRSITLPVGFCDA
ncbi:putative protease Do-like 14 [Phragmites australis]|uniref:putative protease Do-like 14 n=1 Tax=Phragmites australis TaxID=29695 RepID=UPI002D773A66|nr:putative protease Do-like 14 [Phragmites australis]XP_062226008.1 putative protease Do-like 14 [Phragmites australis]XP_062226009.1 putative protease Do-like 14 [Phragmites australis]XP_062226010.1 putative protease Do-like 14 [Phragmites australis]XP_062226012.1 putative protease Do-like 14 [Phragmites australis]XP_062226013.1 putative protease Do-like 14 [Phragmites australis]XP_062226014.1 putative protease Do-like 14 [Phragmites australis]XP_062226015.1 putative protease Do-like 14 [P